MVRQEIVQDLLWNEDRDRSVPAVGFRGDVVLSPIDSSPRHFVDGHFDFSNSSYLSSPLARRYHHGIRSRRLVCDFHVVQAWARSIVGYLLLILSLVRPFPRGETGLSRIALMELTPSRGWRRSSDIYYPQDGVEGRFDRTTTITKVFVPPCTTLHCDHGTGYPSKRIVYIRIW